jgi:hypothetical protein
VTVQDNERERELVRMFNLAWDPAHQRSGVDALLNVRVAGQTYQFEVEVKSSTGSTVSTARDVAMEHIGRWRRMLFVIGFYSRAARPELQRCLCLTPLDMEPWIESIEAKVRIDFILAQRASQKLGLDDLFEVCGQRPTYSLEDAKRLHKQQWSAEQYNAVLNPGRQISQETMLQLLKLRSKYIAERGATLNNPHITKTHLERFAGTNREISAGNWAEAVRQIAMDFVRDHPAISRLAL